MIVAVERDAVDELLGQWATSPYDLPLPAMAVSKRITRLAQHLDRLAAEALAPLDIDQGELDVLATLLRGGPPHEMTPTALTRALFISAGGLTKRLTRLEARGLVARRLDPGDRRSLLVALTEDGIGLGEAAARAHAAVIEELVDRLPPDRRDRLADLLHELLVEAERGDR
jgi:DNA-binding MarR family transcriptional regulator